MNKNILLYIVCCSVLIVVFIIINNQKDSSLPNPQLQNKKISRSNPLQFVQSIFSKTSVRNFNYREEKTSDGYFIPKTIASSNTISKLPGYIDLRFLVGKIYGGIEKKEIDPKGILIHFTESTYKSTPHALDVVQQNKAITGEDRPPYQIIIGDKYKKNIFIDGVEYAPFSLLVSENALAYHGAEWNDSMIGIAFINSGISPQSLPDQAIYNTLLMLITYYCKKYTIDPMKKIYTTTNNKTVSAYAVSGHSEVHGKERIIDGKIILPKKDPGINMGDVRKIIIAY